jgi:enoyl-CoA hydratase/carnithine racemase
MGCSYFLPRLVGPARAMELMLTGRIVDADEAQRIGLVLDVVRDDVVDSAVALARRIAVHAPLAAWMTKQTLWHNVDAQGLSRAMELENRTQTMCHASGEMSNAAGAFLSGELPQPWLAL